MSSFDADSHRVKNKAWIDPWRHRDMETCSRENAGEQRSDMGDVQENSKRQTEVGVFFFFSVEQSHVP